MPKFVKYLYILLFFSLASLAFDSYAQDNFRYQIDGIDGEMLKNLQTRLDAEQKNYKGDLTDAQVHNLQKQVSQNVEAALRPFGYYQPTSRTELQQNGKRWTLAVNITPGPSLPIALIDVRLTGPGKEDPELVKLLDELPLKAGETFTAKNYEKAQQMLFEAANERGYLKAKLTQHQAKVNLDTYSANVRLQLNTGPRYHFGPVSFNKTPYRESLLQRYVDFEPGQPYSSETLLNFQRALTNSAYFQDVTVTPDVDNSKNHQVPIKVKLNARKPQQYLFGAGLSTDTGPRASVGWHWRRASRGGNQVEALAKVSRVQYSLLGRYIIPGKHPATDHYTLGGGVEKYHYKVGETFIKNIMAGYSSTRGYWVRTMNLSYQIEHSKPDNAENRTTRYLIPSINWTRTNADDPIFTRDGSRLSINLRGAYDSVLADSTFIQAEVEDKLIKPVGDEGRLILRTNFGATAGGTLERLPLSLRFIAGGAQSIRGYDYQSIGPGAYEMVGSAEYQHHLTGKWHLATFYDAGSAFDDPPKRFQHAAGVGIVYVSPIGPIEATVARPIGDPVLKGYKFQLTMGPDL